MYCRSTVSLPSLSWVNSCFSGIAKSSGRIIYSIRAFSTTIHPDQCLILLSVDRIIEDDDIYASIDARTESLQTLRELGPPDLVHLVKQSKTGANHQVLHWEQTYPLPNFLCWL